MASLDRARRGLAPDASPEETEEALAENRRILEELFERPLLEPPVADWGSEDLDHLPPSVADLAADGAPLSGETQPDDHDAATLGTSRVREVVAVVLTAAGVGSGVTAGFTVSTTVGLTVSAVLLTGLGLLLGFGPSTREP